MRHRSLAWSCALMLAACGEGLGTTTTTTTGTGGGGGTPRATSSAGGSTAISTGGSNSGGSGAGAGGSGGGFLPGEHAVPPLIPHAGGPVLAHPKLVTITFSDDPNAAMDEAFGDWIMTSSWLAAAATDYGVGTGEHLLKVKLPSPAPTSMTRAQIESLLLSKMQDGTLPMPVDMGGEIYAVYFPKTTKLLLNPYVHCESFSGYHSEGKIGDVHFAFAAIGDCPDYVASLDEQQNIMRTASHEIIEAATDPLTQSAPAYVVLDTQNPWYYFAGEVADVCPLNADITDAGFLAQRYWSNAAAKAGLDPCVPAPDGGVYYNTSVSPTETQKVKAGASKKLELAGWSTAEAGSWKIDAVAVLGDFDPMPALSDAMMVNGGRAELTLSVPANTPKGDYALVVLFSFQSNAAYQQWPVAIVAQ